MKLVTVQIENFRSIEDSTPFTVDPVTCLVGKNEVEKSDISRGARLIATARNLKRLLSGRIGNVGPGRERDGRTSLNRTRPFVSRFETDSIGAS